MKFGPYLKSCRIDASLTQKELARRCGLSDAYINRVENQEADPPTHEVCAALARALGIDAKELWKCAFIARLDRWLRKEGFNKTPVGLASAFFDDLTKRAAKD
jgi:transcriptional regulator with XRE-family HTH domain